MSKWVKRYTGTDDEQINNKIKRMAFMRGIKDVKNFLNPSPKSLHDGRLLKNVDKAVEKISNAIWCGDKIGIFGDPDADGVCSLVLQKRYLDRYGANSYLMYTEKSDGHGIEGRVDMIEEGTKLVIIVDSSSSQRDACKQIVDMGIDVVILDHHNMENINEYATIVNPNQPQCKYPNKGLSGVGVVYKVCEQLEKVLDGGVDMTEYLDIVAVGMYGDMMPVDNLENRYLIINGMKNFNNVGLKRILKGAGVNPAKVNSDTLGFTIVPMINGALRMGQIDLPIALLLEDDDKVAMKIRLAMFKLNEARKAKQAEHFAELSSKVDPSQKIITIINDELDKEFNGLVAQSIAQKFNRPAIIMQRTTLNGQKIYGGSGRTFNDFPLQTFIKSSGIAQAIGHEGAMGVMVGVDQYDNLIEFINKEMNESILLDVEKYYDIAMSPTEALEWLPCFEQMNILTGRGFPKFIAKVEDIMIEEIITLGKPPKPRETRKFISTDELVLMKFKVDESYGSEIGELDIIEAYGDLQMNVFYNFGTKQTTFTPQMMLIEYKKY